MTYSTENKPCTCPSGDGSLRWPCQEHGAHAGGIAELLAKLELHANQAVCDAITDGFEYDPRIGLTTTEENFCMAANPATILALIAHIRAQAAELEAMRRSAPPAAEQPDAARSLLTDDDMRRLRRFQEICEDSDADGHDLPKEAVRRLERAGALRSCGFGRHEVTAFGEYLLSKESEDHE